MRVYVSLGQGSKNGPINHNLHKVMQQGSSSVHHVNAHTQNAHLLGDGSAVLAALANSDR